MRRSLVSHKVHIAHRKRHCKLNIHISGSFYVCMENYRCAYCLAPTMPCTSCSKLKIFYYKKSLASTGIVLQTTEKSINESVGYVEADS
jgi:hypothetical protein